MAVTLTAQTLIKDALLLIQAIAPGEQPTGPELSDALRRLNELIDSWQTQRLTMRVVRREVLDLVADQASYTIGPDGDVDVDRPTFLENVRLLLTSSTPSTEIPLGEFTEAAWQAVAQKDLTNPLPTNYYYEATMPTATLTVWPVPTDASNDLVLYWPEVLEQFETLTASVTLAPGYARALRYNLAVELAPEYGKPMSAALVIGAADALGDIKRLNVSMTDLALDPGLISDRRGGYNINTDTGA